MSRWYVDTSAAMKLIAEEAESATLATTLDGVRPDLVACLLVETELRRAVHREPELDQARVSELLGSISLYELPPSLYAEAGLLAGEHLRTLDALHLGAAIRLGVDAVLTYDRRMAGAARSLGLTVVAPG